MDLKRRSWPVNSLAVANTGLLVLMCLLLLNMCSKQNTQVTLFQEHQFVNSDKIGTQGTVYNGTFKYACDPPCQLKEGFFSLGPEGQIKQIFKHHLQNKEQPVRILDIGMNAGYFTMMSASYGAQVTAFDPQPGCIDVMKKALARPENAHLRSQIRMLNVGVGDVGKLHAKVNECGGGFQGSSNVEKEIPIIPVSSAWTLDDLSSRVELVKIDTEGAEVAILDGLLPYVQKKLIGAIVVELMPASWEKRGANSSRAVSVLKGLEAQASAVFLLADSTPWGFPVSKADRQIPYISGALSSKFDWAALAQDRKNRNAGCNAYFLFN